MKRENLTGKVFGKLLVLEFVNTSPHGNARWKCVCECGKTKIVIASNLKNKKVKSCGCLYNLKNHLLKKVGLYQTYNINIDDLIQRDYEDYY